MFVLPDPANWPNRADRLLTRGLEAALRAEKLARKAHIASVVSVAATDRRAALTFQYAAVVWALEAGASRRLCARLDAHRELANL